nr:DNA translocase FtsK 4TM domain-containing protein [Oceanococcus sp. HetDA_MAG_MS8]
MTNTSAAPAVGRWWQRGLREAMLLLCAGVAVILLVALLSYQRSDPGFAQSEGWHRPDNLMGWAGAWLADLLLSALGWVAYVVPWCILGAGIQLYRQDGAVLRWPWLRWCAAVVLLLGACALASLHTRIGAQLLPQGPGGILGAALAEVFTLILNPMGATVMLLALLVACAPLALHFSWLRLIDATGHRVLMVYAAAQGLQRRWQQAREARAKAKSRRPAVVSTAITPANPKKTPSKLAPVLDVLPGAGAAKADKPSKSRPKSKAKSKSAEAQGQLSLPIASGGGAEVPAFTGDPLPPMEILDLASGPVDTWSRSELEQMSEDIEQHLADYGVQAKVVHVEPGPVITRFELQPAPGVKASRISGLAMDLARALSMVSIRVVEVIPGKSVVGLEIPNKQREVVSLRAILESNSYQNAKSALTLALGKDIAGGAVTADLARMPHLLVAGTTGSGKSVAINAMILSILYRATAEDVRLLMIDPKMLELSVYEGIPHLLAPVVTDMKDAANALRWCVAEMERRYRLMSALGVRNIVGLNRKIKEARDAGEPLKDPLYKPNEELDDQAPPPELENMPYIVVIVDELADLMMVVGKKVEELIARLAQKARAAGMHLILATQRPSTDVLTGLIKANIPTRIGMRVASKLDSRVIMDTNGAEALLGHGDMLMTSGTPVAKRVHGCFVDDHEVHKAVEYLKQVAPAEYIDEILDGAAVSLPGEPSGGDGESDSEMDPLYDEAVKIVTETRKASISWVQRKLKVGYNRAARMIEDMESAGVVSAVNDRGQREVLAPPPPEM